MIPALKAELRKLFSVRSTYVLTSLGLAFVIFYAFYIQGWRLTAAYLHDPGQFSMDITNALTSLPLVFGSIVAILLITHEYRYNTITYTLTASNSRTKVLVAKFLAISVYALLFTITIGVLSPAMAYLGVHAHGHSFLVTQTIYYKDLLWRGLFYGWSSIIAALLIGTLVRNQVAAIVALFVIPTTEQILSLLLKNNSVYLPFRSSNAVMSTPEHGSITPGHAALVFMAYLVVGWFVAWVLFLRRDAN